MRHIRVRGVLISPDTVLLRDPLPLPAGVEVLASERRARGSLQLMMATLETIHAQLEAAGHTSPTPEEVLNCIEAERASWEGE